MTGNVSFYNRLAGWGFAVPDDTTQPDAFIHAKNLPTAHRFVNVGDKISYEPCGMSQGRTLALKIQIIQETATTNLAGGGQ